MTRVTCQNCGDRVDLPAGYTRAKIRCPACGYYAEVPAAARGELVPNAAPTDPFDAPLVPAGRNPAPVPAKPVARANPNPRDTRPVFDPQEGAGTPLLEGTRDEDDEKPYGVPGGGLKKCPHCRGELPLSANFCVHCGTDVATGAKAERTFQPVNRAWDEGFGLPLRLQLMALCGILDLLAVIVLGVTAGQSVGITTLVFQLGLQAFLLGSFDGLSVKRTAKGTVTLTRQRRVAFYPTPPTKVKWKQAATVGVVSVHAPGWEAWITLLYLVLNGATFLLGGFATLLSLPLAAAFLTAAAGFYWFVIRPDRHLVNLADEFGASLETVFRTQARDTAVEVARVVADATGLMYKKTM
jgi:hypothetical protein